MEDEVVINRFIYTDKCINEVKDDIRSKLGVNVVVRDDDIWDIGYITSLMTNPSLDVVVINHINERSIAEITIAAFMCKTILVTTDAISQYPSIQSFTTDCEIGSRLSTKNNSFIHWYKYTIRR